MDNYRSYDNYGNYDNAGYRNDYERKWEQQERDREQADWNRKNQEAFDRLARESAQKALADLQRQREKESRENEAKKRTNVKRCVK